MFVASRGRMRNYRRNLESTLGLAVRLEFVSVKLLLHVAGQSVGLIGLSVGRSIGRSGR